MYNETSGRDYGIMKTDASPFCRLRSVDLKSVRWTEGFWADRFKQCCEVTLPHHWQLLSDPDQGHALTNLRIAAGLEEGEFAGVDWQDEWIYKWMEAAACIYAATGDDKLDTQMDEVISIIAQAQQPDGYIATQITLRDMDRFQHQRHHELYVMGHLVTAACLHHRITGKTSFLNIARKVGDYVYDTFMDWKPGLARMAHNPTIMMGSVELYRTTGDLKYLDLAKAFIDMRGTGGSDQTQGRVPIREETRVVGHGVFYTYLYTSAADVYLETGDETLLAAVERLWQDLTERRMYINTGASVYHGGAKSFRGDTLIEAAGPDYILPNDLAYNETCAQIGFFMWNWRMLAIKGDAVYADLMEQSLYNGILSGIGLDGTSWFYSNLLRCYGAEHTQLPVRKIPHYRFQPGQPPRRGDICCPTNMLRTIAELNGYIYSVSEAGLWIHQYASNTLDNGSPISLQQKTGYPWDGNISIEIKKAPKCKSALMLRIPEWATEAQVMVNGESVVEDPKPGTYTCLQREWLAGDAVTLRLPMPPRLMEAHPLIEADQNRVSVMRGPLLYCLESVDLPEGVKLSEVRIPRDIELTLRHDPDVLSGVTVLEGSALRVDLKEWSGKLYRPMTQPVYEKIPIRLIPYYASANRGIAEMSVWLPLA